MAFQMLLEGNKCKLNKLITTEDENDMKIFKAQGLTYNEIGEMYGISGEAVYKRIKYYVRKKKKCEAEVDRYVYNDNPLELIRLKQKYTYDEIGRMYGVNSKEIEADIRHYRQHIMKEVTKLKEGRGLA
jgi:DNA-directed RNA polymerase specialized sigma24 family protein